MKVNVQMDEPLHHMKELNDVYITSFIKKNTPSTAELLEVKIELGEKQAGQYKAIKSKVVNKNKGPDKRKLDMIISDSMETEDTHLI